MMSKETISALKVTERTDALFSFLGRERRMAGNRFYTSTPWRRCRESFIRTRIATDGGRCQKCHVRPGEIVHHVIRLTPENINDPEVSLNHDNLMFLCWSCHNEIHDNTGNNVGFDEEGNPIDLGRN